MPDLDAPASWSARDPQGMLKHVAELPLQCEIAWQAAREVDLPDEYRQVNQIVILGMGGSAIGADLLRTVVERECTVPISVHRNYGLPAFVDRFSLVMACSYSGNTEETLTGFESALQRRAKLVAVTTGGELARQAQLHGVPLYRYDYPAQPRAALGYSLIPLLEFVQRLGFIGDRSADMAEAVAVMRAWQAEIKESVPSATNAAKQLALKLYQKLPVVYGAEHLSEVARRWKGQFNENAKSWGIYDVLPELNHNTVAGYAFPQELPRLAHVVMLTSALNHPRVRVRFDITRDLLAQHGFACDTVEARGHSPLAQMLSTVHLGDYVSYYLSVLYDVDPWTIASIQFVKERLQQAWNAQAT